MTWSYVFSDGQGGLCLVSRLPEYIVSWSAGGFVPALLIISDSAAQPQLLTAVKRSAGADIA